MLQEILQLDPKSIIFANCVYSACITVILLYAWRTPKTESEGYKNWFFAFLFITLNFAIIPFKHSLPDKVIFTLPHLFSIFAYVQIKEGLAKFFESNARRHWDYLILGVSAVALFLNDSDPPIRLTTVCLSLIAVSASTCYMLMDTPEDNENKIFMKFTAILFVAVILMQAIRMSIGHLWDPLQDPLSAGSKLSLVSILFFVSNGVIFFALIYVVLTRILLKRNKLIHDLENASHTDELTKVYNRRGFKHVLDYEKRKQVRFQSGMALAILDIDLFKNVNDEHGHDCGDTVLQQMCDELLRSLRNTDSLSRWGGDEFTILFPECDPEILPFILERLRNNVSTKTFRCNDSKLSLTISVGAHYSTDPFEELEEMMKKADRALYQAKKCGRNCVVMA